MYKKLKMILLLLIIVITATAFYSCSHENEPSASNEIAKSTVTNLAKQAIPIKHSLTIINKSKFDFAIFIIGAQSNYNLHDNIEIYHQNLPTLVVRSGVGVTYFDYKHVSDNEFSVNEWNVTDHSIRNGDLGAFSCDEMAIMYGIRSNPNNPASDKYPVWNYMKCGLIYHGEYLQALGGNTSGAVLDYMGNRDQGYNSIVKYGLTSVIQGDSRPINGQTSTDVPGHTIPLARVKWSQLSSGIRDGGAVTILIENLPIRAL